MSDVSKGPSPASGEPGGPPDDPDDPTAPPSVPAPWGVVQPLSPPEGASQASFPESDVPPGGPYPGGPYPGGPYPGGPYPGAPHPWIAGDATAVAPEPAGSRRHPMRVALVVGIVVVVLVAGGVALLVNSGPTTPPNTAPQARALFRTALAAAARQRSFHYVSSFVGQGSPTQTTVGDGQSTSGRQVITIGNDTFTVLVIGTACYFQGDARELASQLGLSAPVAAQHARQWISLSPTDQPYQSVSVAVTAGSALASNIAFRPQHQSGTTILAKTRVQAVTGPMTNETVNGTELQAKGTAALYVEAARPHLPVRYTQRGTIQGQSGSFTMTFTRWGEALPLRAPNGAVPFSSLPSGPAAPNPQKPVLA